MKRRALLLAAAGAATSALAGPSGFDSNFDGMQLRDQEDRPFRLAALGGKVSLFNFVYTGCSTVCPLQTHALAEVQQSLDSGVRDRVHFVSVSLDPLSDSPAVLKAFALRMGADLRRWSFVTGRPGDIDRLAEALRLFKKTPGTRRPDDHATALWLADAQGRLMQRYSGNPPDARRLHDELTMFASL